MTSKAYIVANEQQEQEVLEKLEQQGAHWIVGEEKPTKFIPSKEDTEDIVFPYALVVDNGTISWEFEFVIELRPVYEIIYDGREE